MAQQATDPGDATRSGETEYKNAIDFGPGGDIYFFNYSRLVAEDTELVGGLIYQNTAILDAFDYPGSLEIWALDLGVRRYVWRTLHFQADVIPQFLTAKETGGSLITRGFHMSAEVRAGFNVDFSLMQRPFYITFQFFAGYMVVDARPSDFVRVVSPFYVSPIPLFVVGTRF